MDTYIAPRMSEFGAAEMADLSAHHAEQTHWINNYILNTMARARFDEPKQHQFAFNYLRRAEAACVSVLPFSKPVLDGGTV